MKSEAETIRPERLSKPSITENILFLELAHKFLFYKLTWRALTLAPVSAIAGGHHIISRLAYPVALKCINVFPEKKRDILLFRVSAASLN